MNADCGRESGYGPARGDRRPVGRPPGPHDETLAKILPTALRLFLDEGGVALTPTRLHHETGVARATIYRNWPEPAYLLEVMLQQATERSDGLPCRGELPQDLLAAMTSLLARFEDANVRALVAACLEYGRYSERVATAAHAFIGAILEPFRLALELAADNGMIDGAIDDLVAEVAGPVILQRLVMGRTVDDEHGRAVVEHFLAHHGTGVS